MHSMVEGKCQRDSVKVFRKISSSSSSSSMIPESEDERSDSCVTKDVRHESTNKYMNSSMKSKRILALLFQVLLRVQFVVVQIVVSFSCYDCFNC